MKIIRKQKDELIALPFEVGETYETKMATGWTFIIDRIERDPKSDRIRKVYGRYQGTANDNDTICPLEPERLIPRYVTTGKILNVCLCPHCKQEIIE